MEQDVCQMVSSRVRSVKLPVQHVGERSQRMPVRDVGAGKSLKDSTRSQAPFDQGVLEHINIVIEVDEIIPEGLAEHHPGGCGQEHTDAGNGPGMR